MKTPRRTLSTVLAASFLFLLPHSGEAQKNVRRVEVSKRGTLKKSVFEAFSVPDYAVDEVLRLKIREEILILTRLQKRMRDPNRKADVLFRIANLHWLDGRSKYFHAMERYNRQFAAFATGKRKTRPKEPKFSGATSFKIYQRIIKTAPKYQRLDEVLFRAGFHATEVKNRNALRYFQQLVNNHPRSSFRLDAYMEMGGLYFDKRQFGRAIKSFNVVLKEPSKLYNFALYKVSWCFYNQGKVRPAMAVMQRVVKSSKGIQNEIELRDESLKDLVLFYSDLGLVDEALAYFSSIGEPEYGRKVLEKLAGIYFEQARYPKAIQTHRKLLALYPHNEKRPKHHSKLIECFEKSQNLPHAMVEMERFIRDYDPKSAWYRKNGDPEIRDYAYERSEVYARFIPKKHHEASQKAARSNRKKADKEARLAMSYYRKYLDRFNDHKNAYETRFLFAELLFKHDLYSKASVEFELVAKANKKGRRRKEALVGQMDSLTRLEEKHYKKIERSRGKKRKYDPLPLSKYAERLIEADETYVKSFRRDPRVPDILLQRAQLYYNYNQLDRAQKGFSGIIRNYPKSAASHTSRDLTLDIFNIKKDWVNLEKWAAIFLKEKSYATPANRTKLLELIQGSIFQRAKILEEKKHFVAAAGMFERLTNKYPDSKFADKALFNAAIDYINADASKKAMATSKRFLRRYPKSKLVPKMLLAMATYFDDKLDYAHAAYYYEILSDKNPKGKYAADALYNAGIYRENLKSYSKALTNYHAHLKRYPRSKDAPEIYFSIGLIAEKRRRWKEAATTFKTFPKRYGHKKAKNIEAYYRQAKAWEKLGKSTPALKGYKTAIYLNKKYGKTAGRPYAAKSQFELTKPLLREFRLIKLRMPQSRLTKAIERKALLLKRLRDQYLQIINMGDAEMGVTALYHIGLIYHEFSRALFHAPVPKGLAPEEVMLYQQELTNRAMPIEEKAVEAYEKAVKKAFELEVYDKWALKSYTALTQFKPDLYPTRRGEIDLKSHVSEPIAPYRKGGSS